jgi:hypothetical protein
MAAGGWPAVPRGSDAVLAVAGFAAKDGVLMARGGGFALAAGGGCAVTG